MYFKFFPVWFSFELSLWCLLMKRRSFSVVEFAFFFFLMINAFYIFLMESFSLGGSVPGPLREPKSFDFVVPELFWDSKTPTDLPLGSPTTNKGLNFFWSATSHPPSAASHMLFSFWMLVLSSALPVIFVCVCKHTSTHTFIVTMVGFRGRGNKYKFKSLCLNRSHSNMAYDSKINWKPKHPPTEIKQLGPRSGYHTATQHCVA